MRFFRSTASSLAVAIALGMPAVAHAADTPAPAAPATPDAAQPAGTQTTGDSESQIIVTGTHIARHELESSMPISVMSTADAQNYGRNTLYDDLMLNPAIGPGLGEFNSAGQEYDQGVSNINLRNLGANRSLVVVDGQRWVSSGARTQAVDLNTIPAALIDRTEVVTGGASAIYGPDAITGAVNIIMKKEVKGLHLSLTDGISQQGDAAEKHAQLSFGKEFADGRGHIMFGADWTSTDPIADAQRGLTSNRWVYAVNNQNNLAPGVPKNTGPNDGIPDYVLVDYHQFYRSTTPAWCVYQGHTPCNQGAAVNNGQWYQLINGQVVAQPQGSYTAYSNGDLGTYVNNGTSSLSTWDGLFSNILLRIKSVKASGMLRGNYELTPNTIITAYGSFSHSYSRANTEWPVVRDDERATNWYGGGPGEVGVLTDPYMPAALRQWMAANNIKSIPFDRTYANLPTPWELDDRDNLNVGADIAGKLTSRLNWGAYVRYGKVTDHIETENALGATEWKYARNVIADPLTGAPECANAAARAAGCAPFNIFTTDAPSAAFDAYALKNRFERVMNSMLDAGAHLDGSLLTLPYGDLQIAGGVEWRQETLSTQDDPDTAKVQDIVTGGADYAFHPNMYHQRKTAEAYGEVQIPLLKALPFAYKLSIDAAYRYSNYSDNPDTNTWKAGGIWSPIRGITFRGNYSYAVRVPNFGELFAPQTSAPAPAASIDPCDAINIKSNPAYATNCAAILTMRNGLSIPEPGTNRPNLLSGGNPGLTPEISRSYTLGLVIQPKFIPGFDFTVDYWKIHIDNVITQVSDTTILNNCYQGITGYCQYITRNPTGTGYQPGYNATNDPTGLYLLDGTIQSVANNLYENLASLEARGIDFSANYHTHIGRGQFRASFAGTYLLNQITIASVGGTPIDYAGGYQYPRFKGTLMTSYSIGKVTVGVNTRMIGAVKYDATKSDEYYEFQHIPMYIYNDLTVNFRVTDQYTFSLGVRNISNQYAPLQLQANTLSPHQTAGTGAGEAYYDMIGRYIFAKIDLNF